MIFFEALALIGFAFLIVECSACIVISIWSLFRSNAPLWLVDIFMWSIPMTAIFTSIMIWTIANGAGL